MRITRTSSSVNFSFFGAATLHKIFEYYLEKSKVEKLQPRTAGVIGKIRYCQKHIIIFLLWLLSNGLLNIFSNVTFELTIWPAQINLMERMHR